MSSELDKTVEDVVGLLVAKFLKTPHLFYTESSIHAELYHRLSEATVNNEFRTKSGYAMLSIQREYPPIEPEPGSRRGRLDLVLLGQEAIESIDNWNFRKRDETPLGRPVGPRVAIEMGLNKGLTQDADEAERRLAEIDKELARLTLSKNSIGLGLLLYFYRYATHDRDSMKSILQIVRNKGLAAQRSDVWVAAAGFDENQGFKVYETNELRIVKGKTEKAVGPLVETNHIGRDQRND